MNRTQPVHRRRRQHIPTHTHLTQRRQTLHRPRNHLVGHRRSHKQRGYPMLGDQTCQRADITPCAGIDDQTSPAKQRNPQFIVGGVKRDRRMHQYTLVRIPPTRISRQCHHIAVGDRHRLRNPGRPRGVHNVSQIVRMRPHLGQVGGAVGALLIQDQPRNADLGQAGRRRSIGDQQLRGGVLQHVSGALAGITQIDRQIRRPHLTNGQQRGHQLHPMRQRHRDYGPRSHPDSPQPASQPVRPPRQLRIRQTAVTILNRKRIRGPHHLRSKQLRDGRVRHRRSGVVGEHTLARNRIEDLDRVDTTAGIRGRHVKDVQVIRGKRLDGGVVKQVGGVLDHSGQWLRLPPDRG
ncbi:hypothetical protein MSIMFI_05441 [Mycobacterium simulans]|nr:hypothetical protein MSIMFI_05441 [Mycobacterium simulans]